MGVWKILYKKTKAQSKIIQHCTGMSPIECPVCREVERREGKGLEEEDEEEITRTNVTLLSTESPSPLSIKVQK